MMLVDRTALAKGTCGATDDCGHPGGCDDGAMRAADGGTRRQRSRNSRVAYAHGERYLSVGGPWASPTRDDVLGGVRPRGRHVRRGSTENDREWRLRGSRVVAGHSTRNVCVSLCVWTGPYACGMGPQGQTVHHQAGGANGCLLGGTADGTVDAADRVAIRGVLQTTWS
jgi:hypothetical protein